MRSWWRRVREVLLSCSPSVPRASSDVVREEPVDLRAELHRCRGSARRGD